MFSEFYSKLSGHPANPGVLKEKVPVVQDPAHNPRSPG